MQRFALLLGVLIGMVFCDTAGAYYHAQLGRFVSRDPIGYNAGDQNLYGYVKQRPTISLDPTGLKERRPRSCPELHARNPSTNSPSAQGTAYTCKDGTTLNVTFYKCTAQQEQKLIEYACEAKSNTDIGTDLLGEYRRNPASLSAGEHRCIERVLTRWFKIYPSDRDANALFQVQWVLNKTATFLNGHIEFQCQSSCRGNMKAYRHILSPFHSHDVIHVCPRFWTAGAHSNTIIHEATHIAAGTVDHGYVESTGGGRNPRPPIYNIVNSPFDGELGQASAIENADTYAAFLGQLAGCKD